MGPTATVTFGGTGALSFSHHRVGDEAAASRVAFMGLPAPSFFVPALDALRERFFPLWLANCVTHTCFRQRVPPGEIPMFLFLLWHGDPSCRACALHTLEGFFARSYADGVP